MARGTTVTGRLGEFLRLSESRNPQRLLALAILGQCVDDVKAGHLCSVHQFWVAAAEIPESWVRDAGVLVRVGPMPIREDEPEPTLRRSA